MRKQIAAANWKMNLSLSQAEELITALLQTDHDLNDNQLAVFAVPFPYLIPVKKMLEGKSNVFVAAQNCSAHKNGAYTGETSAEMLQSIGLKYVVLGHSERREYNKESNAELADKVNVAIEHQLQPIFCCGEPLAIREAGTQNNHVEQQLKESLFHLSADEMKGFVIAYEPIWAIGTGKTASSGQAQEMHAHIRAVLTAKYDAGIADSISILYGGSVKAANAEEIFGQPDVDGGLVGGASLIATEFAAIINGLKK
ncbi:MAG: triose-phosphate isomerase [Chitinophagaceae bacterium]|nr:MAG: triose-phosphate isomerase [Chitinophagaceae bacterium]